MQRRVRSGMLAAAGTVGAAAAVLLAAPQSAHAVPSFARQTGLACEACHTVFPELTPFGRRFKLNGYVLTTKRQVTDINAQKQSTLSLADLPPLSIMLQASSTWWNKAPADSGQLGNRAQNGATQFPQQLSLFYAGKIADNLGAFFQLTYSQPGGSIGIDNSDIRFADQAFNNDLTYGLSLNNAISVQDLWNTTPAWGAPYYINQLGFSGGVTNPLIFSLGSGTVAGLSAYADYKNTVYVEAAGYRSALTGVQQPYDSATTDANGTNKGVIDNVAPYWRAAYEDDWGHNTVEVGTSGLFAKYQNPVPGGAALNNGNPDSYLDLGLDSQYQYISDNHIFSLLASFWHEARTTSDADAGESGRTLNLNREQLTGSYYFQRKYGGSVSYINESGTSDTNIYGAAVTTGSANGSPNTQYEVLEADYLPWLNTKLALQYYVYNWINGNSHSYDGVTGRNAADNNMLAASIWTAF